MPINPINNGGGSNNGNNNGGLIVTTAPINNPTTAPIAPTIAPAGNNGSYRFGVQLKQSGCRANNGLADPACTPGDIFPNATKDQICVSGYSSSVRNVPQAEKDQVYASYGITSRSTGEYEVDHLVSLELGGSNDISNLWPELASPTPGFHQKDAVENYMHDQVCTGRIALRDAQVQIATNWLAIWKQMGN